MSPTPPLPAYDSASVNVDASTPAQRWIAVIAAEPEPALLSRLMQKLVCQDSHLHALHYRYREATGSVQLEIEFAATAYRADRLIRQWRTLIPVHQATLSAKE